MKQVLSIAKCGCELEKKDFVIKYCLSEKGKKTKRYVCPDHQEEIVNRKTTCDKCGKSFLFGTRGYIATWCKACRIKRNRKNCKKNQRVKKDMAKRNSNKSYRTRIVKVRSENDAVIKGINHIPLPGLIKMHRNMFA